MVPSAPLPDPSLLTVKRVLFPEQADVVVAPVLLITIKVGVPPHQRAYPPTFDCYSLDKG